MHIRAEPEQVASLVLLPGDPGRAEFIAENYLEAARCYNRNRGLLGFTGRYQGNLVSVQTTGMGAPSAAIVIEELITLGARSLVRIGSCGTLSPELEPGDLVLVQGAVALDGTTRQYLDGKSYVPLPDWKLTLAMYQEAVAQGINLRVSPVVCEDAFYAGQAAGSTFWSELGVLAAEMESSALFLLGQLRSVPTASLLTVANRVGEPHVDDEVAFQAGLERMIGLTLAVLTKE
jgi:purine-nucleoside phosphorylase